MMARMFRWGARTATTEGHPLRWLGRPAMKPYVWAYALLYRLTH